jgi:hypothetical protein
MIDAAVDHQMIRISDMVQDGKSKKGSPAKTIRHLDGEFSVLFQW